MFATRRHRCPAGLQCRKITRCNAADGCPVGDLAIDSGQFLDVVLESAHWLSIICRFFAPCPSMQVHINGVPHTLADAALTISGLIELLALSGKRFAVECNGEVVPKSQHAGTAVHDGDRFEIIVAVGGG